MGVGGSLRVWMRMLLGPRTPGGLAENPACSEAVLPGRHRSEPS